MSRGGGLLRAVGREALALAVGLLGVAVLVHALVVYAPGDASHAAATSPAEQAALAEAWGERAPRPARVLQAVGRAATGDLGESRVVAPGASVRDLAGAAWARSLPRLLGALALCALLAAAATAARLPAVALRLPSAAPAFLAAALLVHGLNAGAWELIQRGAIDRPAWFALPDAATGLREALAVAVLAVGSGALAEVHRDLSRAWRASAAAPWVEAAEVRGEPAWPHRLTATLAPACRSLAGRALLLAGGLVVVEQLLLLQGAGATLWRAAVSRDGLLAAGVALVGAALLAALRLGLDAVALWADPRLQGAR